MRGSPFLRVIELPSSTQNGQSPWAEWVHATYVRRFRRAGSAGEFGEDGACCSRGPIACAVRFRACGRGIGAASGLDGRCDHPAQGAMCRLSWSARSAAFTGLRMVSAASSSKEFRHLSSTMGGDAAGLACSCCLPAQAWVASLLPAAGAVRCLAHCRGSCAVRWSGRCVDLRARRWAWRVRPWDRVGVFSTNPVWWFLFFTSPTTTTHHHPPPQRVLSSRPASRFGGTS